MEYSTDYSFTTEGEDALSISTQVRVVSLTFPKQFKALRLSIFRRLEETLLNACLAMRKVCCCCWWCWRVSSANSVNFHAKSPFGRRQHTSIQRDLQCNHLILFRVFVSSSFSFTCHHHQDRHKQKNKTSTREKKSCGIMSCLSKVSTSHANSGLVTSKSPIPFRPSPKVQRTRHNKKECM